MTGLRDQVRLRVPRVLRFYQRHLGSRLAGDRLNFELGDWAARGPALVARAGMHGIRFDRDGIWIEDADGCLWAYVPGLFGSAGGAEFGIRYERFEIELLAARLPAGGVLVDVGANIGLHAIELARAIPDLSVVACEPVSSTFRLLERNLAKNGVGERVTPEHLALGERAGSLRLTTSYQMANFVVPNGASAARGSTEEVAVETLDSVLERRGVGHVDVIKCDVEGAELGVFRGARATLARDHPAILVEIDRGNAARYGGDGTEVVALLVELGYGYERIVDDELLPATDSLEDDLAAGVNFLFTAPLP